MSRHGRVYPTYDNSQSGPPVGLPAPNSAAAPLQNMNSLAQNLPQAPSITPMQPNYGQAPIPVATSNAPSGYNVPSWSVQGNQAGYNPTPQTQQSPPNNQNRGAPNSRIHPSQMPSVNAIDNRTIYKYATTNDGNPPPPATCQWITNDLGNCSPRFMRMTCYSIPCTKDVLQSTGIPFAAMIQPLAQLQPGEVQLSTVDFTDGPLRCQRCGTYINPFVQWVKAGKAYCCKICSFVNDIPPEYFCPLDGMGRRTDTMSRPELSKGSVEFIAKGPMVTRPPSPPLILLALDVSFNALASGQLHAAINSISTILNSEAMNPNLRVGIVTFDTTIHFYNLSSSYQQAQMLVVPDVHEVFLPLAQEVAFVKYSESKPIIDALLQKLPSMFQNTKVTEVAFAAAVTAGLKSMSPVGGRVIVFQSCIPTVGPGKLQKRNDTKLINTDKEKTLYQPQDPSYTSLAQECVSSSVCVDLFLFPSNYLDISTMSTLTTATGGQVYYYPKFSYQRDLTRFYQDLTRNLTREFGYDGVMRIRTSEGFAPNGFHGNFTVINEDELRFAGIDSDKSIVVDFQHDGKITEKSEPFIQCAMVYTNSSGERRIRVHNITLQCSNVIASTFRGADVDSVLSHISRSAMQQAKTSSLRQIRDLVIEKMVLPLAMYRKHCSASSQMGQLILPDSLKLLPVSTLALLKSPPFRAHESNVDLRSFYHTLYNGILNPTLISSLIYPRLYSVHNLPEESGAVGEQGYTIMPPLLSLSASSISTEGAYLLEDGLNMYLWLGRDLNTQFLSDVFGTEQTVEQIDTKQLTLSAFDNPTSIKINNIVNSIRSQRAYFPDLRIIKNRDEEEQIFSQMMYEDKTGADTLSHADFLVQVHKMVQTKLND